METMIENIYNHLVVDVIGDDNPIARGNIYGPRTTDNHGLHTYNAFKDLFSLINPDDQQFTILQKVSTYTNCKFLVFDNITDYNNNDKCNSIVIFSTTELNQNQKSIAHYCLKQFIKDNVDVKIGLFNKGEIEESSLSDYIDLIDNNENNNQPKQLVKKLKQ